MSWSPFLFLRFGLDSGLVTAPALSSVSSVDPPKLESSASATAVLHARLCDASRTVLNPRSFTSMELFSRTQYNIVRRSSLICLLHPHSNWGPPGSSLKFRAAYIAKTTLSVSPPLFSLLVKKFDKQKNLKCPHLFPRCNPVLRIHEGEEATKKTWNGKKVTVRTCVPPWNERINEWINVTYVSIKYIAEAKPSANRDT